MTDHPHAELLRQAYSAFQHGNVQPLLDMLTPDVTFVVDLGPLEGVYTGTNDILAFFETMMKLYDGTLSVDVVDVVAGEHHGVVLTRESGVVDGETISWTSAHVWSLHEGRCDRFITYVSAEYQRFWDREWTAPT